MNKQFDCRDLYRWGTLPFESMAAQDTAFNFVNGSDSPWNPMSRTIVELPSQIERLLAQGAILVAALGDFTQLQTCGALCEWVYENALEKRQCRTLLENTISDLEATLAQMATDNLTNSAAQEFVAYVKAGPELRRSFPKMAKSHVRTILDEGGPNAPVGLLIDTRKSSHIRVYRPTIAVAAAISNFRNTTGLELNTSKSSDDFQLRRSVSILLRSWPDTLNCLSIEPEKDAAPFPSLESFSTELSLLKQLQLLILRRVELSSSLLKNLASQPHFSALEITLCELPPCFLQTLSDSRTVSTLVLTRCSGVSVDDMKEFAKSHPSTFIRMDQQIFNHDALPDE
jgi:hypothetical protein